VTAPAADAPGYNARERIAHLEAVSELLRRQLRVAADRIDRLERGRLEGARHEPEIRPAILIPIRVAAERSALSVRTLKRLIQRGTLAGSALRVTGSRRRRWLVDASALASLLSTTDR